MAQVGALETFLSPKPDKSTHIGSKFIKHMEQALDIVFQVLLFFTHIHIIFVTIIFTIVTIIKNWKDPDQCHITFHMKEPKASTTLSLTMTLAHTCKELSGSHTVLVGFLLKILRLQLISGQSGDNRISCLVIYLFGIPKPIWGSYYA